MERCEVLQEVPEYCLRKLSRKEGEVMSKRKFTPEEVALIHRTMMDGASKDDVALFVATCERTGLDPFARQIMASSRNTRKDGNWVTVWNWLVTIDGLRKIAVDSGDYEGQEGPYWCGEDGAWKEIWVKGNPFAAKVIVHRKGFRTGLAGIAKYESYVQKTKEGKPNQVWTNLGDHMLAKCAEALALRKAFPNEMAGLYTTDEMAQAGVEPPKAEPEATKPAPAAAAGPSEWTIEAQDAFAWLEDRAYQAFKAGGKPEAFEKFQAKWKARKAAEPSLTVLDEMSQFVGKLEAAASKAKPVEPEVAA